jgi:hypothetical protein
MSAEAPRARILSIDLFERKVRLRLPFGFGVVTLTECSQAFVRLVADIGGARVTGATAELLLPKWFDKSPALTNEQNAEQLRLALRTARESYLADSQPQTAWTLSNEAGVAATDRLVSLGLPPLAAQYGRALIDKALADAVLRSASASWVDGVSAGLLGDPYAARLPWTRSTRVQVRHTVGFADRISEPAGDARQAPASLRPDSLERVIRAQRIRLFKIKLASDLRADMDRLTHICSVIEAHAPSDWRATLDGNENFEGPEPLREFWQAARAHPRVSGLLDRTLLLEQPLARSVALTTDITRCGVDVPVIIDESGATDDAFEIALGLGYRGVSTKSCKGLFRSMHSASLVARDSRLILSGEDLMCQAGLALQQDTVLASSLGVHHIERNGHHFVGGFGEAPQAEAQAFAAAHPDLYRLDPDGVHVGIDDGGMQIASLHGPGFASAVHPDWDSMTPLR